MDQASHSVPSTDASRNGIVTLQLEEEKLLRQRRSKAMQEDDGGITGKIVGVALSGGGIRSATFCLGVLQTMARTGLLRKVDYLSTVSGGGYIGSFLGTLICHNDISKAEAMLADSQSKPVRWLRENGRHMAPNGAGDLLIALAVQLRNWLTVLVVMMVSVLPFFFAGQLLACWLAQMSWSGCIKPLAVWVNGVIAKPCGCESWWWWSAWFAPAAVSAVLAVGFGWAYWLVGSPSHEKAPRHVAKFTVSVIFCVSLGFYLWPQSSDPSFELQEGMRNTGLAVAVVAALSMGLGLLVRFLITGRRRFLDFSAETAARLRRTHSACLKTTLTVTGALIAFALVDSVGQSLYLTLQEASSTKHALATIWSASGLAAMFAFGEKFLSRLSAKQEDKKSKLPIGAIAGLIGLLAGLLFLINASLLAHALGWQFDSPESTGTMSWRLRVVLALVFSLLAWLIGRDFPLLNGTTFQQLYAARLVRSYLGASNPIRQQSGNSRVTEVVAGDDHSLETYAPFENGGPLHIINVTLNETCDGKSQLEQRDRKGLPLAIGPAGLSVGSQWHALWHSKRSLPQTEGNSPQEQNPCASSPPGHEDELIRPVITQAQEKGFQLFPKSGSESETRKVQRLSLGQWVGISGAAFSTGMGSQTSLGVSLLTGIMNVRLGYWWDSHVDPAERDGAVRRNGSKRFGGGVASAFPVQTYLLDEWLARFHGPARRHWNLSDGGHFENTAVYELLRRRLPYIICCDCGADPSYGFEDVSGLVRKARIDFSAEIVFVRPHQLEKELGAKCSPAVTKRLLGIDKVRGSLGLPEAFPKMLAQGEQPHGILAVAKYPKSGSGEDEYSIILFIKPALSGDEPLDVWGYDVVRGDFPQEPTSDQFFDEAQWESYRKLGEHSAEAVLSPENGHLWIQNLNAATLWAEASEAQNRHWTPDNSQSRQEPQTI